MTVCHTGTRDLAALTVQADIVVAAIGRPRALTADMVADGAVVIDVGINRVDDATTEVRLPGSWGTWTTTAVAEKASAITPVPGGVGGP